MTYKEFLAACLLQGREPLDYLMPQLAFEEIDDQAEYTTEDIAYYVSKSDRTIRRWFSNGYIKAKSKNPWISQGIDVKEALYIEFKKEIMTRFNGGKKY